MTRWGFLITLSYAVVLFAVRWRLETAGYGLTGDEPHYLLIVQSLVNDGNLDLTDEYDEGFADLLKPDLDRHTVVDRLERNVSLHHIGLPLVVALPYVLGGVAGAFLTVIAMACLCFVVTTKMLVKLGANRGEALAISCLVFCTAPMLFYSVQLFPELPAMTLILLALNSMLQPDRKPYGLTAAILFLPWLHIRFMVISAGLTLAGLLTYQRRRALSYSLAPLILTGLAATGYYWRLLGNPLRVFSLHPSPKFDLTIVRAIVGLLLDQRFGLLFYAPFLIVIPAGWLLLLKQNRLICWQTLASVGTYLALVATFPEWWGGWCPPCRYLIPLFPFLVLPLWAAIRELHCKRRQWVTWGTVILSLLITRQLLQSPKALYNRITEPARILKSMGLPSWVSSLLPDFTASWPMFTAVSLSFIILIAAVNYYVVKEK